MMSMPERSLVVVAGLRWSVGLAGFGVVAVEVSGLVLGVGEDVARGTQDASLLDVGGVLVLVDRAAGVAVDDRLEASLTLGGGGVTPVTLISAAGVAEGGPVVVWGR
jgi:hypothetical protein